MEITFWHWLAIAVTLMSAEMIVPGAFLLWIGAAAALTAIVALIFPQLAWEWQLLVFGVAAIDLIVVSRILLKRKQVVSDDPTMNRRTARMVGQLGTLETAISNGHGRALIGDSAWPVTGPDLPIGTAVRVAAADGATLRVEQA